MNDAADICIIGAGSSGMTVAKALKEKGLRAEIFEKGSDIGGMWRYQNDTGQGSCYASLHIDTSRPNLGYSDFPLDPSLPDFPSHAQFLSHLERYADRFGLRDLVRFRTEVASVTPKGERYEVALSSGEVRDYGHVIVANGHLSDPRMPEFAGTFDGDQIHSHHYRTADPYAGKRVMVVGLGNSAVDIAVDIARRAEHVIVSTRRSAWVMPKYLMGVPIDQVSGMIARRFRLSTKATRRVMSWLIRLGVGDQRRLGLPRPEHPMWREHATLSQELLPYIGHGYISVKPNVQALRGDRVAFVDGSEEPLDAIIYATGYKTTFPFLPAEVFDPEAEAGRLYRRMISLKHPGLIFAGLVQPVGPTIPLVEIQGQWIAGVLAGDVALPDTNGRTAEVEAHQALQHATYLDSKRYVLEVDYRTYAEQMRKDMRAGSAGLR
ncbi:NAD(P)-binding domain-containing protein [Seohaeicola saemankumensis]|nr:NAD(P)-binding domain-containing protein [Seohaeicola saemankumensis]MCA0870650.1 NAD(P)-binding domain-containing protein [Seohaeicola saemankumensis]